MTDVVVRHHETAILTSDGEVIELALSAPITVDEAGLLLPRIRTALDAVRRYAGYLEDMVKRSMVERGQRERRAGDTVYELRGEADWIVDDAGAMFALLTAAYTRDEITREELDRACQQVVTHRLDHRVLAMLAKRVPEIDTLRRRVDGEPRLRVKS